MRPSLLILLAKPRRLRPLHTSKRPISLIRSASKLLEAVVLNCPHPYLEGTFTEIHLLAPLGFISESLADDPFVFAPSLDLDAMGSLYVLRRK